MKKAILFLISFIALNSNAIIVVSKCDDQQRRDVVDTVQETRKEMIRQIKGLRDYKKNFNLDKDIKKKVNSSIRVLRCSIARSYITRVRCNETNRHGAIAYTLAVIGTTIWVNPDYWTFNPFEQTGIMIHELTHKCLTGDEAYFWDSKPRDINGRRWSGIADTYRYWHENTVCIPQIDC